MRLTPGDMMEKNSQRYTHFTVYLICSFESSAIWIPSPQWVEIVRNVEFPIPRAFYSVTSQILLPFRVFKRIPVRLTSAIKMSPSSTVYFSTILHRTYNLVPTIPIATAARNQAKTSTVVPRYSGSDMSILKTSWIQTSPRKSEKQGRWCLYEI